MIEITILQIVLVVLGLLGLKFVISLSKGIWTCFLGYTLGFGIKWKTGDNVWAVITGATDGIGLEYAKQLAKIGYNLVIISRSEDKLKATQKYLKENYNKKVRIIAVDFNRTDIYDKITKELNSLDVIDVLINNVGILYKCADYFTNISTEFNESYLNVNINSYLKLIEIVLPKMVKQKRGIIINISSQAAVTPLPLMTTYAATKAFIHFLSEGLSFEYESKGVTIQVVLPSLTKTKLLQEGFENQPFAVTAEEFVSSAIKTVGIESKTFGHWRHKLLVYIMECLNQLLGLKAVTKIVFNDLKQKRNLFYKKYYRKSQ